MDRSSNEDQFADFVTLVYHEARNVRHLGGFTDLAKYERLRNLATNRDKAWEQLQPLRCRARHASAAETEELFRSRFKVSLAELAELATHAGWRHTSRGGNRWAKIAEAVISLGDAIEIGDEETTASLLAAIPQMCHNTGRVQDKLIHLDASLNVPPCSNTRDMNVSLDRRLDDVRESG